MKSNILQQQIPVMVNYADVVCCEVLHYVTWNQILHMTPFVKIQHVIKPDELHLCACG